MLSKQDSANFQLVADLAYQRGFDGYLLNFEGAFEARALASWIAVWAADEDWPTICGVSDRSTATCQVR